MEDLIYFDYNQKSSILLIFFFNAILFSFLLLKKGVEESSSSSKWLSLFIFLGACYISPFLFGYAGWYSQKAYKEFLFFVPFQQLFLIGPVFYYYVQNLLNVNFKFSKKDLLHFLPALLYLSYSLIVFITDKLILDKFYFYADGKDKDLDVWYQASGLISMLFYLIISYRYYIRYRKFTKDEVSFADEISYKWIQYFSIVFGIIIVLRIVFFILNPEWWNFGRKFWYYLCFSILLLYITITGYYNTIRASISFNPDKTQDVLSNQNKTKVEVKEKESIELTKWKEKINLLFNSKKVFQNPNLTLSDIASQLKTNRSVISNAINQEFEMNFNDLVNKKRIEAVIEKFHNLEHHNTTLLGIALDCGFNSKTTFNRAFKKHTAVTPKQYINKNLM